MTHDTILNKAIGVGLLCAACQTMNETISGGLIWATDQLMNRRIVVIKCAQQVIS